MRWALFAVMVCALAVFSLAEDIAWCVDQNTQCQVDCCNNNGGHFTEYNEIDCQGFPGDFETECGDPCYQAYVRCAGYGEEEAAWTDEPEYGYQASGSSSGSCCGAFILLGTGLGAALFISRG